VIEKGMEEFFIPSLHFIFFTESGKLGFRVLFTDPC